MLLPELPEALIVRRNAHGFSHSFTALQMDKYGRDCAEAAQMEVARLTKQAFVLAVERDELRAELGDLPQAQAEMLAEIKVLRTIEPMTEVADRYAHRLALELECVLADRPDYYDKAMQVLGEYRSAMNAIHEQHSPTHMGEPLLHNVRAKAAPTAWRAGRQAQGRRPCA